MSKKILVTLVFTILAILVFTIPVFADPPGAGTMKDMNNPWSGNSQVKDAGNSVLGIIQIVGNIMAVGTLMLVGIRYMLSSPEDKASIKARAIPYLIGATLVFAAVNIMGIVANMAETIK